MLTAMTASFAAGDEVRVAKATYYDVTVLGGRDGQIEFRGPAGNTISKGVGEVTLVVDDDAPAFTAAERLADAGDIAGAVAGYESALAGSTGQMASLIRYRLLAALDRQGSIDRAAEVWLALLAEAPDSSRVIALRPTKLGARGSATNADAILLLEAASKQANEELRRRAIDGLLLELNTLEGRVGAAEVATRIAAEAGPGGSAPRREAAALADDRLDALAVLVRQGRAREVYTQLTNSLRADSYDVVLRPKALLISAEAQQNLAAGASGDERRKMLIGAGLDAMRAAALFPSSPQAPQALLLAGKVCQDLGNLYAAANAYKAVVQDYPSSPAARAARDGLRNVSAAPRQTDETPASDPPSAEHGGRNTQETP
jgi:tetratricopeptide (TPR) repeat protein